MHTQNPSQPTHDTHDGLVSPLLSPDAAAAYVRVHRRTLANWRVLGRGPRYVRVGRRAFYRLSDLNSWLDQRVFTHTASETSDIAGRRSDQVEANKAARMTGRGRTAL
jgi:Helix-turn-helix domain